MGAPLILVYFSGDWDVHWGYDSDFEPWPYPREFFTSLAGHLILRVHKVGKIERLRHDQPVTKLPF